MLLGVSRYTSTTLALLSIAFRPSLGSSLPMPIGIGDEEVSALDKYASKWGYTVK
jgi:hypothetical protein